MSAKSKPQGHCLKPRLVLERSFVNSVTELVCNVMPNPSSSSSLAAANFEKVEWVSFEECDLTDPIIRSYLEKAIGSDLPIIAVVGYTCGYQIWALLSNGECEELISVRDVAVNCVKFLPQPKIPTFDISVDKFSAHRPLLAVCNGAGTIEQVSAVNLVALKSGDSVRTFSYDSSIVNVLTNNRVMVVMFTDKLVVMDVLTFNEQFWIKNCYNDMNPNSAALSSDWLAYSDTTINPTFQSCGGASTVDDYSYTNQVVTAAKNISRTVSEIGVSLATTLSGGVGRQRYHHNAKSPKKTDSTDRIDGIVTILHVEQFHKRECDIHSTNDGAGIVAHFLAHTDEVVVSIAFNPNGSLLLTSGQSGQYFNVFLILPHPSSSAMGAVQHLYTLQRGSTIAKILNISFSPDSRWVAISTVNGTTHLFPITPYGGHINVRTHAGPRIVNRESRFHRSAGLENLGTTMTCGLSSFGAGGCSPLRHLAPKEQHPSTIHNPHASLYRAASNPRLPPYSPPVVVLASSKIKQQFASAFGHLGIVDFGIGASCASSSAHKKSTRGSAGSKKHSRTDSSSHYFPPGFQCRQISAVFAPARGYKSLNAPQKTDVYPDALYVIRANGQLSEYQMSVKPFSISGTRISEENAVELHVIPTVEWPLIRCKTDRLILFPVPDDNVLILAAAIRSRLDRHFKERRKSNPLTRDLWISQVEIVTYGGPHRRLWMGPQFTFKTYIDSQRSASLVHPNGKNSITRSEPMAMPGCKPLHSVPVLIEASSTGSFDHNPGIVMEVCGSWSDNDYISCDEQEVRLRESIAEAMLDRSNSPAGGSVNAEYSSCSGEDLSTSSDGRSRCSSSRDTTSTNQLTFGNADL